MPSVREWHNLSPIEQSLAEHICTAHNQLQLDAFVDGYSQSMDIAVKPSLRDGWLIFNVPPAAMRR